MTNTMLDNAAGVETTRIQSLIWPEKGICTERDMYVRLNGPVALVDGENGGQDTHLRFARGGWAGFGTWFNLFNLGKWVRHCGLKDLRLRLEGEGEFGVNVMLALSHRSWESAADQVVTLEPGKPVDLDLSHLAGEVIEGAVVFFELIAMGRGRLDQAFWMTGDAPRRGPELMLSITTFRREEAVTRTVNRFQDWIETSPLRGRIRLSVIDNGQTVTLPDSPDVTLIASENLGGAGGFSRGLLAARDTGATHCLFMDDDGSCHMGSVERTWMFLAYAKNPATAISGAMINAAHRWAIWENGARFFQGCQPLYGGTDLRDPGQAIGMEFATTQQVSDRFYGGWWYFAFSVEHAALQPFPFFVRGDDVSFSLAQDFHHVTLNGVVSFQDSFTDKESPLTWYLDLRSHMAHHLALPGMEAGRKGTLKIAIWFFLRNLPRMHYETLTAINMALEDVIRGPEFFDEHADMAARRAEIKALTVVEAWAPAPEREDALPPLRWHPLSASRRFLMKITLNGHLIPFYARFGRPISLAAENRGHIGLAWGASEITCLSPHRQTCYTVRHSKPRAFAETLRFARGCWRFFTGYERIRKDWRTGYERLTGQAYWREKLKLSGPGADTAHSAPGP